MFGLFGGGFPGAGGGGAAAGGRAFEARYRCYPVSFLDKAEAERGDKVFLPPSALDRLASLHVEYPMLFAATNARDGRATHCGVLEFVADEGAVYMPYWMMQNLLLTEGDVVTLRSAALPKGRFVKLRPHSKEFLDISNPRAVLEMTLRSFSCLTVGDTVPIHYNGRVHAIDVLEARPGDAISVIETDCEVDFAPPLDYVEPDWKAEAAAAAAATGAAGAAGAAGGASGSGSAAGGGAAAAAAEAAAPPAEPAFLAFAGAAQRLDGKAVGEARPVPVASAPPGGARLPAPAPAPAAADADAAAGRRAGKLMFKDRLAAKFADGGAAGRPGAPAAAPPPPAEETKDEAPAFKAFTGKGNSLK